MSALGLSLTILAVITTYIFIIRPWHLNWGAYVSEIKSYIPGDEIVDKPSFRATRGISIEAPAENIWQWIVQIGSKRAGWYSIDWIDNGGIASSEEILPEFQSLEKGQFVPFTPDQKNGMWVKEFKTNRYILWADKDGKATWAWFLYPESDTSTRLVTRLRTKYVWKGLWIIYYIIYDFGDIIMMSKCLKGIKNRAEKYQLQPNLILQ